MSNNKKIIFKKEEEEIINEALEGYENYKSDKTINIKIDYLTHETLIEYSKIYNQTINETLNQILNVSIEPIQETIMDYDWINENLSELMDTNWKNKNINLINEFNQIQENIKKHNILLKLPIIINTLIKTLNNQEQQHKNNNSNTNKLKS